MRESWLPSSGDVGPGGPDFGVTPAALTLLRHVRRREGAKQADLTHDGVSGAPAPETPSIPPAFAEATMFHVKQWRRLEIYANMLVKWQKAINLVGPATLPIFGAGTCWIPPSSLPLIPADGAALPILAAVLAFQAWCWPALTEFHLWIPMPGNALSCAKGARLLDPGRVAVYAKGSRPSPGISPMFYRPGLCPIDPVTDLDSAFCR